MNGFKKSWNYKENIGKKEKKPNPQTPFRSRKAEKTQNILIYLAIAAGRNVHRIVLVFLDAIPWDEVKFSRSAKALSRSSGFPVALGTLKWEEFPQRASAGERGGGGGWI